MLRSTDRLMLTIVYGVPFALLSAGFVGFLRLAITRRSNVHHLLRRRLSGRAS